MHNHGGGGSGAGAWVNLLPLWLQAVFLIALCAVAAWSLIEVAMLRGTRQIVAGLHVLVAAGMVDMFAPWVGDPGRARFWQIAFGAATIVALLGMLAASARRRDLLGPWGLTALDTAAMTWMFLLFDTSWAPLTYVLVGVYALLTVAWVHGALDLTHRPICADLPAISKQLTAARMARSTQALMSASMAWMFLIMAPQSGGFFGRAFTSGLTEDTWWAIALIGLLLRAAADPVLVRRLVPSQDRVARSRG